MSAKQRIIEDLKGMLELVEKDETENVEFFAVLLDGKNVHFSARGTPSIFGLATMTIAHQGSKYFEKYIIGE